MPYTTRGYEPLTAAEWLLEIRARYEQAVDYTPDWERDSFLGNITLIMSELLGDLDLSVQEVWDAFDPNNAVEAALESIARLVGVTRQPATFSTVDLTLSGTGGTVIPTGSLVEDDTGQRWQTTEDATLPATVAARATETGPIAAAAGTITTVVTSIAGWTGVTNAAAANLGSARQSDASLRRNRLREFQAGTTGGLGGILSAVVASDPNIQSVSVFENTSNVADTVEGSTLDPHSILVVVWPASLGATAEAAIRQAIYNTVAGGIKTMGAETGTVTGSDGFAKDIAFDYATGVSVDNAISLTLEPGFVLADVVDDVEAEVANYYASLGTGEDLYSLPLCALIATIDGVLDASISFDSGSGPASTIPIFADEIAIEGTTTVT